MNDLYENNMKTLKKAIECCEEEYSHDDIISILSSDDDIKKQLCLIELNHINEQSEADILTDNLTQKSGPIRETSSSKILDLISNPIYNKFFQTENILNSFVKGITDINPTVSRNIVEVITFVQNKNYLIQKILDELCKTINEIGDLSLSRSYELNKKNFNLYWNLEALFYISDYIVIDETLSEILDKTANSHDYTIREKTAKLACKLNIEKIKEILKNDENIYVRKYF